MEAAIDNLYVLDATDRIAAVGPNWDSFALENAGEDAAADRVIGHYWWEFVNGHSTRSFLNTIFFACRSNRHDFDLLYRCDRPQLQRLFRMTVMPDAAGRLTVEHKLVHTKATLDRSKVTALGDHHDASRCSICLAFNLGGQWVHIDIAPDARDFPKGYGICDACRETAQARLEARAGRVSPLNAAGGPE